MRRKPTSFWIPSKQFVLVTVSLGTLIFIAPIAIMILRAGIPAVHLTGPLLSILIVSTGLYGLVRGGCNHPAFDAEYRQWLAQTPWTPAHPLPKGPLGLVGADLLHVALLMLVGFMLGLTTEFPIGLVAAGPLLAFVFGLALAWTCANIQVGQASHGYAVAWVPVVMALAQVPAYIFLAACPFIMAAIAWHGVRRSLQTFPWPETASLKAPGGTHHKRESLLGWPFRQLLREGTEMITTPGKALVESLLAAGWVLVVAYGMQLGTEEAADADRSEGFALFAFFTVMFAIGRVIHYGPVICSKFCWGMRIANRRPIIWRHDQIFLAPLLMLVIAGAVPRLLYYDAGASLAVSFAVGAGLVVLVGRGMGPSLRELQLTGVHSKFGQLLSGERKDFTTPQGFND